MSFPVKEKAVIIFILQQNTVAVKRKIRHYEIVS